MYHDEMYLAQLTEQDRREYLHRIASEPGMIESAARAIVRGAGHALQASGQLLLDATQREIEDPAAQVPARLPAYRSNKTARA